MACSKPAIGQAGLSISPKHSCGLESVRAPSFALRRLIIIKARHRTGIGFRRCGGRREATTSRSARRIRSVARGVAQFPDWGQANFQPWLRPLVPIARVAQALHQLDCGGYAFALCAHRGWLAPCGRRNHFFVGSTADRPLGWIRGVRRRFSGVRGPRHFLHFGTSYKITAQQQIDLHAGVGLSAASVDHLVGIGYSFCFRTRK